MSASLVGSEMCIRDSRLTARRIARASERRAGGLPRSPPEALRPPLPVSYTHLTLPTICSV
eukprot:13218397-Alexandrium_andersonii.AAC.1